jgi:hypothetical protein
MTNNERRALNNTVLGGIVFSEALEFAHNHTTGVEMREVSIVDK